MSQARTELRTIMTPEFRVAFPHVFTTAPPMAGSTGPAKYQVVMLFPKDADLSALKNAAGIAAEDKWGAEVIKLKEQGLLRSPFRDGDEHNAKRKATGKQPLSGYDGHIFISVSSIEKPPLVDQNVQPIIIKEDFYAGCYAQAQVYAHAYNTAGNMGMTFFLNAIQKTKDGESFGGKANPQDIFGSIGGGDAPAAPNGSAGSLFD